MFIKLQFAKYATRKSAIPIDIITNAGQEMDIVERRIRFQLYWSVEDGDKADEKATNEKSANLDDLQLDDPYCYL